MERARFALVVALSALGAAPDAPSGATLSIDGPPAVAVGGRAELVATASAGGGTFSWRVAPVRLPAGSPAALANPRVRLVPRGERVVVHGLLPSASSGDVELIVEHRASGTVAEARFQLTCVEGNLTSYRPQHGGGYFPHARTAVPDAWEEDDELGPGIRRNGAGEVDPNGEDDLIELTVTSPHAPLSFKLVRSNPALRLWTTRTRTAGSELAFTADRSAAFGVGTGGATLWVEWDGGPGLGSLALVPAGTAGVADRVRFHTFRSIVMALGGEGQVPSVPVDPNHGTYLIGIALYGLGYDAHLFDEDAVSASGAGAVYDEVVNSIQRRGVVEVVSIGYSHGGGSTWDLVDRLDANRGSIGAFGVPFTSYVDGVQNDSDLDVDQELKYPPTSAFHVNSYQVGTLADFFLDGGPVPGSHPPNSGLNVETTAWGAGATHFVVDDFLQVLDYIRTNLLSRVNR